MSSDHSNTSAHVEFRRENHLEDEFSVVMRLIEYAIHYLDIDPSSPDTDRGALDRGNGLEEYPNQKDVLVIRHCSGESRGALASIFSRL